MLWAFKTYVRPILEYASSVWSPYLLKDIDLIEGVQRRYTKKLHGLGRHSYLDRLIKLGLDSLELRRLKADLVSLIITKCSLNYAYFYILKSIRGFSK